MSAEPDNKQSASRNSVCIGSDPETWIDTVNLFHYQKVPGMDFDTWAAFIPKSIRSSWPDSPFGLLTDANGRHLVNLQFAEHLAKQGPLNLFGAMACIVIDEELHGLRSEFPRGHAWRMIRDFEALALDEEKLDPPLLHEFLEVRSCFDCWIREVNGTYQPVHGRDYFGNTFDDLIGEANYYKSSLAEQIQVHLFDLWFSKDFATRLALATPTRRGALLRMLLGDTPDRRA